MAIAHHENYAVTDRGGVIENRHKVDAAVVDAKGNLLFYVGDPLRLTHTRSALKPAQALAVLETGGFHASGFDDGDLSLMCASHNCEERHLTRARKMLEQTGAEESYLQCGGHLSVDPELGKEWIRSGITPTAAYSNCSGKHAAMLAGAKALGAGFADYHLPEHPMQLRVKATVEDLCGLRGDSLPWSTDGCNLPQAAMPLSSMGVMFSAFAEAADAVAKEPSGRDNQMSASRTQKMARIFHAMSDYPEYVAGENRYCTDLMRAFEGALIGKVGADACYAVGVRASDRTRQLGADGALGIAVKIDDGNLEILYAVISEILDQLRLGTPETLQHLDKYHHVKRKNTVGVVTGQVTFAFRMHPAKGQL